jgi:hypothetical protein
MNPFFRTARNRLEQLIQVIGLAILLAGCAAAPPSPENLTALVRETQVYLPHDNLAPLVSDMKDKEMVFLGEVHDVSALRQTATDLVVALASEKPVVYACESTYGQQYFAKRHPSTKGKVMSIRRIPVYQRSDTGNKKAWDIDAAVKPLMKEGAYCYLSLPQFQQRANHSLRWSAYYPGGRPICDGLLFVKAIQLASEPPAQ